MYICIYVYINIYEYIHTYIHIHVHMYIYKERERKREREQEREEERERERERERKREGEREREIERDRERERVPAQLTDYREVSVFLLGVEGVGIEHQDTGCRLELSNGRRVSNHLQGLISRSRVSGVGYRFIGVWGAPFTSRTRSWVSPRSLWRSVPRFDSCFAQICEKGTAYHVDYLYK